MATYLPNVNRYVSKTKAFTPDFKFLSDALDKRQDRYDTNYKQMNNLYGSVLHADLSREDNMGIRDEYVKNLAPRIQQISGMDLSLQQNVDAAKGVFTPFFEDNHMVRDIVFTKRYKGEVNKMNQFRKSDDEDTRTKFWQGGIDMLNFSMADFKKGTREDSMNVALPELVENVNLVKRGFDALKDSGMNIQTVDISPDGNWIITQKNGVALTRRKSHKDPVSGDWVYYSPAQNFILETMMDDPLIHRYYDTKFYVEARKWWEANADKHGGEENAKRVYLQDMIDKYKIKTDDEADRLSEELNNSVTGMAAWEDYKKNGGDLIPGSDEMTTFERHKAEMEYLQAAQKKRDKINREILANPTDIDDLLKKASIAYKRFHIGNDTAKAAHMYADIDSEQSMKVNDFALENDKHQMRMIENEQKHYNALNQTAYKEGWQQVMGEDGLPIWVPLPWAESGNPFGQIPGQNVGTIFNNDNAAPGDATSTGLYQMGEDIDYVDQNMITTAEGLDFIRNKRWDIVFEYYSKNANAINSDDNNYTPEGMKVNGEFMSWEDAKNYYLTEKTGDELKQLYQNVVKTARSDVDNISGPDLQRSNPELYNNIIKLNTEIDNKSVMLLTGWEEQFKVYQGAIKNLAVNKEITMLEYAMLDAYPIFNSRGQMQSPDKIQERMITDFTNYINGNSKLSPEEAAENFGFYDVADMNETIGGAKGKEGAQVAQKHFNNVFNEFWGKHSVEDLFQEVKNKINHNMSKADAVAGHQNFNLASYMSNQKQAGGGGLIYNWHPEKFVSGQPNTNANVQMNIINELLKSGKGNYIVQFGDKSSISPDKKYAGWQIDPEGNPLDAAGGYSHPDAVASLQQLIIDLGLDPNKDFTKGQAPGFSIKWAERIGGKGDKSGWVITYDNKYAKTQKGKNNIAQDIPQNTITVFAPTEWANYNPNAVSNSYVSITEYLVNQNKSRTISNDGGHITFFRDDQGRMNYVTQVASFDGDPESDTYGNIVLGKASQPKLIQGGGYYVDQVYNDFMAETQRLQADNQDAMRAHKKTLKK